MLINNQGGYQESPVENNLRNYCSHPRTPDPRCVHLTPFLYATMNSRSVLRTSFAVFIRNRERFGGPKGPTHPLSRRNGGGVPPGGRRLAQGETCGLTTVWRPGEQNTKKPGRLSTSGLPKNGGYLLSQLVGQYHRRW